MLIAAGYWGLGFYGLVFIFAFKTAAEITILALRELVGGRQGHRG